MDIPEETGMSCDAVRVEVEITGVHDITMVRQVKVGAPSTL